MWFFGRGKPQTKTPNLVLYALTAIVDGNAMASPLGSELRLAAEHENRIRTTHKPRGTAYINDTLDGASVILCWMNDGVDALCFLSEVDAQNYAGFRAIPAADLIALDARLRHFPRQQ